MYKQKYLKYKKKYLELKYGGTGTTYNSETNCLTIEDASFKSCTEKENKINCEIVVSEAEYNKIV